MENSPTKRKSKEKLQAQAESFSSLGIQPHIEMGKELKETSRRQRELREQGYDAIEIATKFPETLPFHRYYQELKEQGDLLRFSEILSGIRDLKNIPEDVDPRVRELIKKYYPSYISFLRKENREIEDFLEKNIIAYEKFFKDKVSTIKEKIKNGEPATNIPEYLSEGTQNYAFKITVQGKDFVAKIPKQNFAVEVTVMKDEIRALMRGGNLPYLSHLYAYSYTDGASIIDFIAGESLGKLSLEEKQKIHDDTIISFVSTVKQMKERGIRPDIGSDDNFLFNKENERIYMIDYHITAEKGEETFDHFYESTFGEDKKELIHAELNKNL